MGADRLIVPVSSEKLVVNDRDWKKVKNFRNIASQTRLSFQLAILRYWRIKKYLGRLSSRSIQKSDPEKLKNSLLFWFDRELNQVF